MVMSRIFKRKEKEEGRQEGLQEAIEADKQRREGESLAQAVERLRQSQRS